MQVSQYFLLQDGEDIRRQHPNTIKSSSMLRCSRACQYCLHNSLSWLRWSGKPWRISCLSCLYSWLWSAWYLRSFRCILPRFVSVMALNLAVGTSGWLWMWNSASVSSLVGSVIGFRDRASGPLLQLPFTHWAVKLKAIKRDFSHWSLGFSISWRHRLLGIGTSVLWSVRMWKCWSPSKNTLHFEQPTLLQVVPAL